MNVLLLNAHSPKNAGDLAILHEVVAMLRAAYPGAHLTATMNDPDRQHLPSGVRYVDSFTRWVVRIDARGEWSWRKWLVPLYGCWLLLSAISFRLAGLRLLPRGSSRRATMAALYEADVVVVIGGGHLYARRRLNIAFAWLWLGLVLAPLMGKPLVFLPQSFGPLPGRLQQAMLRLLLRHSAFVAARELHSLRLLAAIGVRRPVFLLPDLAFGSAAREAKSMMRVPELEALLASGGPVVGLTLMDWQAQNVRFQNQKRYEEAALALIRHVAGQGGRVAIFAQCIGPTAGQDDRIIARRIVARAHAEQLPIVFVERVLSPGQLRDAYARLDVLVATRMHSAIFALGGGVPTLVVGYLYKSIGIMELLGLGRFALAIDSLDTPTLLARFDELWAERSAVRLRLADRIPLLRHTLEQLPALLETIAPRPQTRRSSAELENQSPCAH